jgi:hypothetical protein
MIHQTRPRRTHDPDRLVHDSRRDLVGRFDLG